MMMLVGGGVVNVCMNDGVFDVVLCVVVWLMLCVICGLHVLVRMILCVMV